MYFSDADSELVLQLTFEGSTCNISCTLYLSSVCANAVVLSYWHYP